MTDYQWAMLMIGIGGLIGWWLFCLWDLRR